MPFFSFKQLLLLASCPRCYGEHHAGLFYFILFFVSGEPVLVFLTKKTKKTDDATDTLLGYLILSFNKIPINDVLTIKYRPTICHVRTPPTCHQV